MSRERETAPIACPLAPIACLLALASAAPAAGDPFPVPGGGTATNVEDPFEYFANSWTVVGLKDHPSGARISPRGELVLGGGTTVRPLAGAALAPLAPRTKKTLIQGWLPVVREDFVVDGSVRYVVESFAVPIELDEKGFDRPLSDNFLVLVRATAINLKAEPAAAAVGFEWSPEAKLEARAEGAKAAVFAAGSLVATLRADAMAVEVAGSRIAARAELEPQGRRGVVLRLPFRPVPGGDGKTAAALAGADFDAWLAKAVAYWTALAARGAYLYVPEDKARCTWYASLAYQFIGRDRGEVHAGEGFYDEVYLRDGAYQAISLAHAGYLDEARESLEPFLRYSKPTGQLVSQEGQLDANGYGMWAPVEAARLSGDLAFLRRFYPAIRRAAEFAMAARRTEKDPASPFSGLLPAAPADGENLWAGKNHILGYDWQNLRGIACVAEAARRLGEKGDAERFGKEFEDYRAAILRALDRTGLPYLPPSFEKVGTHWGNLEVIFPTPLLDPRDPRIGATLAHVRTEFGAPGGPRGLVEGTMQWTPGTGAIHPYMSQFVTNSHIVRGEQEEAVDGFYSFLLHTTSTNGFPEGVYPRKREAWGDTVPHLWAAALYVTTLRNMIVREFGDELHLLSAVPGHWLEAGRAIRLAGAPTAFGKVSILAEAGIDSVSVLLDLEKREAPARIVVHLPPGLVLRSAEAAGKPLEVKDGAAVLPGDIDARSGPARLAVDRRPAGPAADFAARAAAYEAEAASLSAPIPGLRTAPFAPIDPAACVLVDLSPIATTNPLDGPFGTTPAPAFTGLAMGDLTVAGIPFRTVDPAKNGGKGLVVLDGAETCKGLPVEVEVPAGGARGRWLCILGGVTGWAPGDPGVGKYGAVAEYEVRYADGSRASIPVVPGRTADDWLGAPAATEVAAVLRGSGWHLNVIVAALEAKPIAAVTIRDLGTPSAPVTAAITIVK